MNANAPLQPTLWRTCRVLANRTRLEILRQLFAQPDQSVSTIAERLKLPLPVASQYLRAMEARGLLAVRRRGRYVKYRPGSASTSITEMARALVTALGSAFEQDGNEIEAIFKTATAFTHPRRIEIYRLLKSGAKTVAQLNCATKIPSRALLRHLKKLGARGFVACAEGINVATTPKSDFGRVLAKHASA